MHSAQSQSRTTFLAHYRESDHEEQDLWSHLKQTGKLAASIATKIRLPLHGELLGLLHDLGKATVEFDQYIRRNVGLVDPDEDAGDTLTGGKIDHSSAGAQVLYEMLPKESLLERMTAELLSLIIASHH